MIKIPGTFKPPYSFISEDGKETIIHRNYVSKSMLLEGDVLFQNINPNNGEVFYKYEQIPRTRKLAEVMESDTGELVALVTFLPESGRDGSGEVIETRVYKIIPESISYHQLQEGDKVQIHLPANNLYTTHCAVFTKLPL